MAFSDYKSLSQVQEEFQITYRQFAVDRLWVDANRHESRGDGHAE
jgi:hypothetical protein